MRKNREALDCSTANLLGALAQNLQRSQWKYLDQNPVLLAFWYQGKAVHLFKTENRAENSSQLFHLFLAVKAHQF
jgi:hypothetical protein